MNIKILGAFAAVALLAACSQQPAPPTTATGAGARPLPAPSFRAARKTWSPMSATASSSISTSSSLRPDAQATLDKQAAWLRQVCAA